MNQRPPTRKYCTDDVVRRTCRRSSTADFIPSEAVHVPRLDHGVVYGQVSSGSADHLYLVRVKATSLPSGGNLLRRQVFTFRPATDASIPEIVPPRELGQASRTNQSNFRWEGRCLTGSPPATSYSETPNGGQHVGGRDLAGREAEPEDTRKASVQVDERRFGPQPGSSETEWYLANAARHVDRISRWARGAQTGIRGGRAHTNPTAIDPHDALATPAAARTGQIPATFSGAARRAAFLERADPGSYGVGRSAGRRPLDDRRPLEDHRSCAQKSYKERPPYH